MSRHARIEVRPVDDRYRREQEAWGTPAPHVKPSSRPHYVRRVAANGAILWHTEAYSNRRNAVRAAEERAEGLWVHIYGDAGRILRMIEPTRWDRDR